MKFIDVSGVMQRARRYVSGSDNVQDEQVKDPVKLGEILRSIMRRVSAVEATVPPEPMEFEVNVGSSGALTTLTHNFGQNVRYFVTDWRPTSSVYVSRENLMDRSTSVATRGICVGTWLAAVSAPITTGAEFKMKSSTRRIVGVRFAWGSGSSSVTASLWRNDTGELLASKVVTTSANSGFFEAIFDTAITTDLTGTTITVGISEAAGNYVYNNDTLRATLTYEISGDLTAVHQAKYALAANTRPTTSTVGGYYMVEPIIGADLINSAPPMLSVDSSTTTSALVLKSYVEGKAVIRVEPTQNGASA